jgi:transposase
VGGDFLHATKFGISHETLRNWVRRAETDDGLQPGLTSEERERLKTVERENTELRRATETSHALEGQAAVAIVRRKAACSL